MPLDGPVRHAETRDPVPGTSGRPASVRRFAWSEGPSRGILASRSADLARCLPRGGYARLEKGETKLTFVGS